VVAKRNGIQVVAAATVPFRFAIHRRALATTVATDQRSGRPAVIGLVSTGAPLSGCLPDLRACLLPGLPDVELAELGCCAVATDDDWPGCWPPPLPFPLPVFLRRFFDAMLGTPP
jgi:hypothetical protein